MFLSSKVMVCDKLRCIFSSLFFIGNTTNSTSHKKACPTNVNETIIFDKSRYKIVSEVIHLREMVKQDFSLISGQCSQLTFIRVNINN